MCMDAQKPAHGIEQRMQKLCPNMIPSRMSERGKMFGLQLRLNRQSCNPDTIMHGWRQCPLRSRIAYADPYHADRHALTAAHNTRDDVASEPSAPRHVRVRTGPNRNRCIDSTKSMLRE